MFNRTEIKIEIYPERKELERFHVMQKDHLLEKWREVGKFKTLDEAEEFSLSRAENVKYKGIFEDGKRKGMMDFTPAKKVDPYFKKIAQEKYKDYDPEKSKEEAKDVEYETKYLRRIKRSHSK